jgi:branched-chain amino acid transport system permease protein
MLIPSALITGCGLGAMYGLLALGFYMTYTVSRTVNFAQGSSMMLGAVLCYSFAITWKWPLGFSIILTLALCAVYGLVVERFAVRPFVARGSNAWLMSTVAVGIVLENLVHLAFGKEPRSFPSPLATGSLVIGGLALYPLQLLIPAVGLGMAGGLQLFSHRTTPGKALLAVMQNPDAARLMGINVTMAIALAFAGATVFAGIAGLLIAPIFYVSAHMGVLFGIKAFAVAILGGLTSAWGVMIAGLLYGVVEALIIALFGSPYTHVVTFTLVILALATRPHGLFGRAGVTRV